MTTTNMNLKITLKSQLKALRELIIISIIYFILMYFLYVNTEFDLFKILFWSTFSFYFLIVVLPVAILHINYLNNNCFKEIVIDKNRLIVDAIEYSSQDINEINIFATKQHFDDSTGAYSFAYNDYYYHIEICLKNNEKIILSSLLDYKLDKILKENFNSVKITENAGGLFSLLIKGKTE